MTAPDMDLTMMILSIDKFLYGSLLTTFDIKGPYELSLNTVVTFYKWKLLDEGMHDIIHITVFKIQQDPIGGSYLTILSNPYYLLHCIRVLTQQLNHMKNPCEPFVNPYVIRTR